MRKNIQFVLLVLIITVTTKAQPPAGNAKPGDWYGAKFGDVNSITIAEAVTKLTTDTTIVEATFTAVVLEVCPKKGCWMKLAINDSTTAFVKMKNYGFFVPLGTIGKTVLINGEMRTKIISVEELQHYAEDAKQTKEQIAAINKPKREIRVIANGISVVQ